MPRAAAVTSARRASTTARSRVALNSESVAFCPRSNSGSTGKTAGSPSVAKGELVEPDDDPLVVVDRLGVLVGRLIDLALLEAGLDALDGSAHLVDAIEVLPRQTLDLVGQRLDEVRTGQRVGCVDDAALVADDLLRSQRNLRAPVATAG